jgi:hypothetical protein
MLVSLAKSRRSAQLAQAQNVQQGMGRFGESANSRLYLGQTLLFS